MRSFPSIFLSFLLCVVGVRAQFQFFEQMFQGGGGQQQQQAQNVASDSSWYQANYDNGIYITQLHRKDRD
jgi:hypothetical protein